MGCGGSKGSAGQGTEVATQRRRLSVGNVDKDKEDETGAGGVSAEAERGLIQSLNQQSVIEMLENDGGRKMSIGSQTDQGKVSFSNKTVQKLGDDDEQALLGIGYTCRKGLKPESPNQDSWTILKLEDQSIYGVFDGHGQKGHDVSQFVKDCMPKLILKDQRFKGDDQGAMLKDVFKKTQSLVVTSDRMKKLSAQMSGTTATLCIHNHKEGKIIVAHVADSTCVLGSGSGQNFVGKELTRDHKPNLKDEKARIEKNGGRVVFDGYANHRVYAKNARYPGLNMSRCIGDIMGHQDCGITCEPEVKEVDFTPDDKALLLCSDGVWEFIEPNDAVSIVMGFAPEKAMVAAERLAKEAWDRWIREEGGAVVDDITVVLVRLDMPRPTDGAKTSSD